MCFTTQSFTVLKQGHQDKLLIRGRGGTKAWMPAQRLKLITRSGRNVASAHYSVALTFCTETLVFLGEQCHWKETRWLPVTSSLIMDTKASPLVMEVMPACLKKKKVANADQKGRLNWHISGWIAMACTFFIIRLWRETWSSTCMALLNR